MPQFNLQLVTPPANEPVTLTQAKNWLKVDVNDDDSTITSLISAARQFFELYTQRQLCTATWLRRADSFYNLQYSSGADPRLLYGRPIPEVQGATGTLPFAGAIVLPRSSPFQQLLYITYVDTNGVNQCLTSAVVAGISSGLQTVTPTTMVGISNGTSIIVDVGAAQETVIASGVTATTFNATFANSHPAYVPLWFQVQGSGFFLQPGFGLVIIDPYNEPARLTPAYGQVWPVTREIMNAVSVAYKSGYSDDQTNVPAQIQFAILELVSGMYIHREAFGDTLAKNEIVAQAIDFYNTYEQI